MDTPRPNLMLSNPKPGRRIVLHYRASARGRMPHGERGVVEVTGNARPRNHLVRLDDGRAVVVPAGNLRTAE